jgi:hypothetical protein
MTIGLTDTALDGLIRRTSIPCAATAVIIIIVPVVTADANMNAGRVEVEALRILFVSRALETTNGG